MQDNTQIQALVRRVEALEDELAIRDLLTRHCFGADSGDAIQVSSFFDEACDVDIDGAVFMKGRSQVRASVESQAHQAMLPRSCHLMGPLSIQVAGSRAVALGYMTLFMKGETISPARQSFGRWELEKKNGKWLVVKRTARSIGRTDTKDLL